MSTLNEFLRDRKLQAAADERKRQRRLALRRGYDKAGRERRARAKALAESGLQDLPLETQVTIQTLEAQSPAPEPEGPKIADATVGEMVERLIAIRERIFRLSALFAVSLSSDCAMEANRYLSLFQTIAAQLEAKDANALATLTRGFESLLMSPPFPTRRTIPLDTQELVELRWEAMQSPAQRAPTPPTVSDGLDWMVG
jgi:hypothetical protein